jgi:hypothetical protein
MIGQLGATSLQSLRPTSTVSVGSIARSALQVRQGAREGLEIRWA